jgi:cyanophycinase
MTCTGQGFLLVIGGGGEKFTATSWERIPYQWAVDRSENRRVAIISFYSQSNALPDFFVEELQAETARNFLIDSKQVADDQATYDSLMNYDVIFLKGGDQYNYYSNYRDTRTAQAIMDKFQEGGVICGTSAGLAVLGGVDYVASNGSADPGEALSNPLNTDITLEDDFLPLMPGVIFDSHFAERGRFGRLLAFLSNWQEERDEILLGVGVDDMTALVIDTTMVGTVYGTGAANFYRACSATSFSRDGAKLAADSIRVSQLLHQCTYDFRTGEIKGLTETINPSSIGETGNYTVLASGGDALEDNEPMLYDLVNLEGDPSDPILILTRSIPALAIEFRDHLVSIGATGVETGAATLSMANNDELKSKINHASRILFVDLNIAELFAFLYNGETGDALKQKVRSNGMVTAFVGDLSRIAGRYRIENTLTEGASYEGALELSDGLGLLRESVIIPNTWSEASLYENMATAIPYFMVKEALGYGIWLSPGNYLKYFPAVGKSYIAGRGDPPVMILRGESTRTGISDQTSYGDGGDLPRMVAGFVHMTLSVLADSIPCLTGKEVFPTGVFPSSCQQGRVLFSNPASGSLRITAETPATAAILSMDGRTLWKGNTGPSANTIPLEGIPDGFYILTLQSKGNPVPSCYKIQVLNH